MRHFTQIWLTKTSFDFAPNEELSVSNTTGGTESEEQSAASKAAMEARKEALEQQKETAAG